MFSSISNFWDLEQYEDIDWKLKINFLYARAGDSLKIKKMKYSAHDKYMEYYKQYIQDYKIAESIEKISERNLYLYNRLPIIKTAMQLFKEKNYVPFVYLMVPQVEGLFDVYKSILDINDNGKYNGLSKKLEVIYKEKGIWGYVYYAFDFPKLRNDIAHGSMINIDEECAFDILMDISHLIHEIDSDELNYKVMIDFFERFAEAEDKVKYILEYFSSKSLFFDTYSNWLSNYIQEKYCDIIRWYRLEEVESVFIETIESEQFRAEIFNDEPLKTYEEITVSDKEMQIINVNDNVLNYIPMLNFLKQKFTFPKNWLVMIENRIEEINMEHDKKLKMIRNVRAK